MNAVTEIDVVIDTKVYTVLYFYSEVNTTKTSTICNWVKRKTQLYIDQCLKVAYIPHPL